MLGWNISVFRQHRGGSEPATFGCERCSRLAVWQAQVFGLEWIKQLVAARKGVDLGGGGYPSQFTVKARDLREVILEGPPHVNEIWLHDPGDILTSKWVGRTFIDREALEACSAEEWLVVEAWDES